MKNYFKLLLAFFALFVFALSCETTTPVEPDPDPEDGEGTELEGSTTEGEEGSTEGEEGSTEGEEDSTEEAEVSDDYYGLFLANDYDPDSDSVLPTSSYTGNKTITIEEADYIANSVIDGYNSSNHNKIVFSPDGYIYNTTPLNLASIRLLYDDENNFTIYVGNEPNPRENEITGEGHFFIEIESDTYTITDEYQYFTVCNNSAETIYADYIEIMCGDATSRLDSEFMNASQAYAATFIDLDDIDNTSLVKTLDGEYTIDAFDWNEKSIGDFSSEGDYYAYLEEREQIIDNMDYTGLSLIPVKYTFSQGSGSQKPYVAYIDGGWKLKISSGNTIKIEYISSIYYIAQVYINSGSGSIADFTATPNAYITREMSWGDYYLWYHYYNGASTDTQEVTFTATADSSIYYISTVYRTI